MADLTLKQRFDVQAQRHQSDSGTSDAETTSHKVDSMSQAPGSVQDSKTSVVVSEETLIARPRLDSVDMLRGLAIVLMSLDHVREFLSVAQYSPTDVAQTSVPLFLTRWATHFCAPVFVFLAGTGAYLYGQRGHSSRQVSAFLLSRGLWLVFLELTVIRLAWYFNFDYGSGSVGQVIWAIGWSMVVMSGLVFLPFPLIFSVGVVLIAGHNSLDSVTADRWGTWSWLWRFLHDRGPVTPLPEMPIYVAYPLIPWVGVMATGYAFGTLFQLPPRRRKMLTLGIGAFLTASFFVLRFINGYGDPAPWTSHPEFSRTIMSFLNLQKYPPSLLFLLMTLGPSFIVLATANRPSTILGRMLVTFGRVPLFYYVLHLYLIHAIAIALIYVQHHEMPGWLFSFPPGHAGEGFGYGLPVLYLIWMGIVVALFPLCTWFADLKRKRSDIWLSYL